MVNITAQARNLVNLDLQLEKLKNQKERKISRQQISRQKRNRQKRNRQQGNIDSLMKNY